MKKKWSVFGVALTMLATLLAASPASASSDDAVEAVESVLEQNAELRRPTSGVAEVAVENGEVVVGGTLPEGDVVITRSARGAKEKVVNGTWTKAEVEGGAVVAESLADGLRVMEVINSRSSTHRFVYRMTIDGKPVRFVTQDDGSVIVGFGDPNKSNFEPVAHRRALGL